MTGSLHDFHNHIIPRVDDGAQDIQQSRDALAAFRAQGIRTVVTTPHVQGSLTRRPEALQERLSEIDAGWTLLHELAAAEFPDLRVERGAEVMLDDPEPDLSDTRLRLAGGHAVLVEFQFFVVPPRSAQVLRHLNEQGLAPVLAHPERYEDLAHRTNLIEEWREVGATLQVNCGSLLGRYGPEAQRMAYLLLENSWADYLSSDYHARGTLHVEACRELLERRGATEHVRLLLESNPRRLLQGERPLPVPPLRAAGGLWSKVAGLFR